MLLFSVSKIKITAQKSDRRSLIYETRVPRVEVYIETNPGWLELSLTGTNFHGTSLFEPLKLYCIIIILDSVLYELDKHFCLSDDII